jgi:hypothetical protein
MNSSVDTRYHSQSNTAFLCVNSMNPFEINYNIKLKEKKGLMRVWIPELFMECVSRNKMNFLWNFDNLKFSFNNYIYMYLLQVLVKHTRVLLWAGSLSTTNIGREMPKFFIKLIQRHRNSFFGDVF